MLKSSLPQRLLGLDFGLSRIGVAVGQTITKTAMPLSILKAQNGSPNWQTLGLLLEEWNIDAIIVGIPFNMDGTEQPITHLARQFAKQVKKRFQLPIHFVDERLTTVEAKQRMRELGFSKKDLQQADSYAAKLILESWFRQQE